MTTAKTAAPPDLGDVVRRIKDLPAFSAKSGIPYRTLFRIKHEPGHNVTTTTRLAIEGAIKRYRPEMKGDGEE